MRSYAKFVLFFVATVAMLFAVAAFAQCPGGQCPAPSWNPQAPAWRPLSPPNRPVQYPAVVHVNFEFDGQAQALGSGFIADRNTQNKTAIVITCAHGYKALMGVSVVTQDGRKFAGTILCVDAVNDLLIAQIADPGITPLVIDDDIPAIGDDVFLAGFPGQEKTMMGSWGKVTGWYSPTKDGDTNFIATSCHSKQGCSGGPILSKNGKVVATVTGNFDGCVGPCLAKTLHLLKCKSL